jgi:hypothetical protein
MLREKPTAEDTQDHERLDSVPFSSCDFVSFVVDDLSRTRRTARNRVALKRNV